MTGLTKAEGDFIIVSDLQTTIDSITSYKGKTEIRKLNIETVTPLDIKAISIIFINGLDKHVGQRTPSEIATEQIKNFPTPKLPRKTQNYSSVSTATNKKATLNINASQNRLSAGNVLKQDTHTVVNANLPKNDASTTPKKTTFIELLTTKAPSKNSKMRKGKQT